MNKKGLLRPYTAPRRACRQGGLLAGPWQVTSMPTEGTVCEEGFCMPKAWCRAVPVWPDMPALAVWLVGNLRLGSGSGVVSSRGQVHRYGTCTWLISSKSPARCGSGEPHWRATLHRCCHTSLLGMLNVSLCPCALHRDTWKPGPYSSWSLPRTPLLVADFDLYLLVEINHTHSI